MHISHGWMGNSMMVRKNGIRIESRRPEKKKETMKIVSKPSVLRYNKYVELMRGYGETVVVPLESSDYELSIKQGYVNEVERWSV